MIIYPCPTVCAYAGSTPEIVHLPLYQQIKGEEDSQDTSHAHHPLQVDDCKFLQPGQIRFQMRCEEVLTEDPGVPGTLPNYCHDGGNSGTESPLF